MNLKNVEIKYISGRSGLYFGDLGKLPTAVYFRFRDLQKTIQFLLKGSCHCWGVLDWGDVELILGICGAMAKYSQGAEEVFHGFGEIKPLF